MAIKNQKKIDDPYKVVKYPLSTEKSIRLMEAENKLIFVVDKKANKNSIKKAIESMFNAKVKKINTFISPDGKKRHISNFQMRLLLLILLPS